MMEKAVLETKRLMLRKMRREDQDSLNKMLQDPEVMYAYAHAFSDREAKDAGLQRRTGVGGRIFVL